MMQINIKHYHDFTLWLVCIWFVLWFVFYIYLFSLLLIVFLTGCFQTKTIGFDKRHDMSIDKLIKKKNYQRETPLEYTKYG